MFGAAGFGLFFASDHCTDRYFGISGTDLAAFAERGGTPYPAEGGVTALRVPFQLTSPFDRHRDVTLAGRYERLLGDAQDKPIVDRRDSANQWMFGGAIQYAFRDHAAGACQEHHRACMQPCLLAVRGKMTG